jgi:hypothetical protein
MKTPPPKFAKIRNTETTIALAEENWP